MRRGDQTREMTLEQAADLFSRRGYFGSSIADIMHETGLGRGGIYTHFDSKDALALAAFDHAVALVWERVAAAQAGAGHAADQLLALVDVFRSLIREPLLQGGCLLLNTAVEADDAHPDLRRRVRDAITRLRELARSIVAQGIAACHVRPEVDGEVLASLLLATLEGAVILSTLYRDPIHIYRAAEHPSISLGVSRRRCGHDWPPLKQEMPHVRPYCTV
ncbi:MAG: TetR/AcrR family transcriptional regulator [Ktedonobacterales bacterium]